MQKCSAKMDEVPNWFKIRSCEEPKVKGPQNQLILQELLLQVADAILMDERARGLEMNHTSITTLLRSLVEIYNEEAGHFNKTAEEHHQQLEEGREESGTSKPKQVSLIPKDWNVKKLDHMVHRMRKSWGYGLYRQDRPSKHLNREQPSMKAFADYIQSLKVEKKVDSRLMFNWGQVWTCTSPRHGFIETVAYIYIYITRASPQACSSQRGRCCGRMGRVDIGLTSVLLGNGRRLPTAWRSSLALMSSIQRSQAATYFSPFLSTVSLIACPGNASHGRTTLWTFAGTVEWLHAKAGGTHEPQQQFHHSL